MILRIGLLTLLLGAAQPGLAHAAALPAGTESVPLDMQDLVEGAISPHLVLPQSALWDFEFMAPYVGGGKLVCGRVNYQTAMRTYVGPQRFYALVKRGVVTLALLQDPPFVDTTGDEAERFKELCDRK